MTEAGSARAARGAATVSKLLDAAVAILRDEGAAAASIQRVADAAGTSKGLVHYHFADKDALFTACANQLTADLIADETAALAHSSPASAVDDLWAALTAPDCRGRRRALLALSTAVTPQTRPVLAVSAAERLSASAKTVDALAELMQFDMRVSRNALATAFVALMDGLVANTPDNLTAQHRHAYDAFWLAVLSLTA